MANGEASGARGGRSLVIAVVGGGAAGLATAIFAARRGLRVVVLDGAPRLGAKILVSGGGRCNVTNVEVTERDFRGGEPRAIRSVLRAFPCARAAAFFAEIGVPLRAEEHGKLFPVSNRARSVLEALSAEAARQGVEVRTGARVTGVSRAPEGFGLALGRVGELTCASVVLATGGRSLPKSGSDGGGYALAEALGHSVTATVPALVPLRLDGTFHARLAGVAQDVELHLQVEGARPVSVSGALLWTHFGVSGPAVLDVSRFVTRALAEGRPVRLAARLVPGRDRPELEEELLATGRSRPHTRVARVVGGWMPTAVAEAAAGELGLAETTCGRLTREQRALLLERIGAWPLLVAGSRGWNAAEVTAGGVPLGEVDTATMASRRCPGLFLVGEILDVDGRLGGFNFQWAWSTAWVAAAGLARGGPSASL